MKEKNMGKYISLLFRIGMVMVVSISSCFGIGLMLVNLLGISEVLLIVFVLIGIGIGFVYVYKEIQKLV